MFKLKYKGQEIGLDTDCRIEWDSVKTDSSNTLTGWSGSHEEMDESSRRLRELLESLMEEDND